MARVEELKPEHFHEWGADFEPINLLGYAVRDDDGNLTCLGGLWIIQGVAWATFDSRGDAPRLVHRLAIRLLKEAGKAGIPAIWAELDASKPKAQKWMERCGFEYVFENESGVEVWRAGLDG